MTRVVKFITRCSHCGYKLGERTLPHDLAGIHKGTLEKAEELCPKCGKWGKIKFEIIQP